MGDAAGPILVVDQDDDVRGLVASVLAAAGFDVLEAETGEIALELADSRRPRLALVDVFLPGLSGYELCYRLKTEFRIPVVLVSRGSRESLDQVAGSLLGADDCLTKPVLADDLLARVRLLTAHEVPDDHERPEDAGGDRDGVQDRRHYS
jgi:DNA-binding response OmpR family regulator